MFKSKRMWLFGAIMAAVALAVVAISYVTADSNNPGIITSATYDANTKTLSVTGTSNCTKHQPMGIAFFALYSSGNPPAGDTLAIDKPDATIDVLSVVSGSSNPVPYPLVNKLFSPGVASYSTNCSSNQNYSVTLGAGPGSPNELDKPPERLCQVEYHIKGINGSNPNTTADGPGRNTDNSFETNGNQYLGSACFLPPPPELDIRKLADAREVDYGTQIGFGIAARNFGGGGAIGVAIDDDLPNPLGAASCVTWSVRRNSLTGNCVASGGIEAASCHIVGFPNAGDCTVSGAMPDQHLHCDVGTVPRNTNSYVSVVHVTSPTTRESADCPNGAVYENVASASAPDRDSLLDTSPAEVIVNCPSTSLDKSVADTADVKITATYSYGETNDGDVDLHNVAVTDDSCRPVIYRGGDTNGDGLLNPGESWLYDCTGTYTMTSNPEDLTNRAVGSGTSPCYGVVGSVCPFTNPGNHIVTYCGSSPAGGRICNNDETDSTTIHVEIIN